MVVDTAEIADRGGNIAERGAAIANSGAEIADRGAKRAYMYRLTPRYPG